MNRKILTLGTLSLSTILMTTILTSGQLYKPNVPDSTRSTISENKKFVTDNVGIENYKIDVQGNVYTIIKPSAEATSFELYNNSTKISQDKYELQKNSQLFIVKNTCYINVKDKDTDSAVIAEVGANSMTIVSDLNNEMSSIDSFVVMSSPVNSNQLIMIVNGEKVVGPTLFVTESSAYSKIDGATTALPLHSDTGEIIGDFQLFSITEVANGEYLLSTQGKTIENGELYHLISENIEGQTVGFKIAKINVLASASGINQEINVKSQIIKTKDHYELIGRLHKDGAITNDLSVIQIVNNKGIWEATEKNKIGIPGSADGKITSVALDKDANIFFEVENKTEPAINDSIFEYYANKAPSSNNCVYVSKGLPDNGLENIAKIQLEADNLVHFNGEVNTLGEKVNIYDIKTTSEQNFSKSGITAVIIVFSILAGLGIIFGVAYYIRSKKSLDENNNSGNIAKLSSVNDATVNESSTANKSAKDLSSANKASAKKVVKK